MTRAVLPIDHVLGSILAGLRNAGAVVLKAPPGAGKTTGVPLAMLETDPPIGRLWLAQPRRLAARAAAARLASLRGTSVGQEVGYQVRFDRRWGKASRIVAVTTGVLLRRLQADPFLEGIDAVALDEFHERSLEADLALGMLHRLRQTVRPDLKLLVMSATLDPQPIADFLSASEPHDSASAGNLFSEISGDPAQPIAPAETSVNRSDARVTVVRSEGRSFPVDVRYSKVLTRAPIEQQVADVLPAALSASRGDVLVFLPGVGEIRRTERQILATMGHGGGSKSRGGGKQSAGGPSGNLEIMTLFGDMSPAAQDRVLQPQKQRKVVLATNVAETSVTIPGVTAVIDSGQARVLRYDPRVGLPKLEIEPISRASAAQRAGRAGRTEAGICFRLWPQATHRARPERDTPEVLRSDLAGAVLQLAGWGESDVLSFPWLDPPPEAAVATAKELLRELGAIESGGPTEMRVTELGRRMLTFPVHPRLARLLIAGEHEGVAGRAAIVAAMLSERDPFRGRPAGRSGKSLVNTHPNRVPRSARSISCGRSDVVDRLTRLEAYVEGVDDPAIQHAAAKQIFRVAEQLGTLVDGGVGPQHHTGEAADEAIMRALLAAYPDRLARRRAPGSDRAITAGGQGVRLMRESQTREGEFFVCVDVQQATGDAKVRSASAVHREWLDPSRMQEVDEVFFHPTLQQVTARHRTYWNGLMLAETPTDRVDESAAQDLLYEQALRQWQKVFPADDAEINNLIARIGCLSDWMPEVRWPSVDEKALREICYQLCRGRRSIDALREAPWRDYVLGLLSYEQQQQLERFAPPTVTLPSGNRHRIRYELGKPPILAVRLQELFGWRETPRVADGRVPLQLHLLAPNQRPQQITDDLHSFWVNTYPQVRKDLRGRYPKHHWPEDPLKEARG